LHANFQSSVRLVFIFAFSAHTKRRICAVKAAKVLKSVVGDKFPGLPAPLSLHPRHIICKRARGRRSSSLAVRMMIIAATFSAYLSPSNRNSWVLHAAKCVVYAESISPFHLLFHRRVDVSDAFTPQRVSLLWLVLSGFKILSQKL
jgi:hypothetical protein